MALEQYDTVSLNVMFNMGPSATADAQHGAAAVAGIRQKIDELLPFVAAVQADKGLSALGKRDRVSERVVAVGEYIDRVERGQVAKDRTDRDRLRARVSAVPKVAVEAALVVECRLALQALPDGERWAVIDRAVADGETLVWAAVAGAPRFVRERMIPAALFSKLEERVHVGRDPESAVTAAALDAAIANVTRACVVGRSILADLPIDAATRAAIQHSSDPLAPQAAA